MDLDEIKPTEQSTPSREKVNSNYPHIFSPTNYCSITDNSIPYPNIRENRQFSPFNSLWGWYTPNNWWTTTFHLVSFTSMLSFFFLYIIWGLWEKKKIRKDATLREVLTTLRNTAPHVAEYRHPLGRFSFRTVYADPSNKGRFSQKELGMVYSRDILGEPGSLHTTAPRLLEDDPESSSIHRELNEREKEERTLEELRFVSGDFLLVAVLLPKNVTLPSELSIKGSGGAAAATALPAAWRTSASQSGAPGKGDSGWGRSLSSLGPGTGRGGGHWRGESNAPTTRGRGGGGRGGGDFGRDRDRDRERDRDRDRDRDIDRNDPRVPPPRRNEPPSPRGGGRGGRGGRGDRRSRSRSRSWSPPRRRNRYDWFLHVSPLTLCSVAYMFRPPFRHNDPCQDVNTFCYCLL